MRVDVVAENPLESLLQVAGIIPTPVVQLLWSVGYLRAFQSALELELFEVVASFGDAGATAQEVAERAKCDPTGTRTLLSALNGFGLLRRKNKRFTLSKTARKWVLKSAPRSQRPALAFGKVLERMLQDMTSVVKTGKRENFHERLSEDEWRGYLRGLASFAELTAPEIVRKIPVQRSPRKLLDVAGGHGVYSMAMVRRHSELQSEVLDLAQGCAQGRALVQEAGLSGRVSFREGDLTSVAWGDGYDVVFLFNILHNLREEQAREAVRSAFRSLRSGGTVAVLEGDHSGTDDDLSFGAGFGELVFFVLSESEVWSEGTMRSWMTNVGFERVARKRLLTMPETMLLIARKP